MSSLPSLTTHFIDAINKGMTPGDKLMILLHGRGDTLDSYKLFVKELNITGLNYLLVNAPFIEMFGHTWYDDSFSTDDLRYQKSMELLQELLKEQATQWGYGNIFLFGFSQGGRMVLDLFLREKRRLAGVIALSPRVTSHSKHEQLSHEIGKTPVFVAHGQHDPIIPINETKENLHLFKNSCESFIFHSYPMGHEIDIFEIHALREWMNEYL